jgi:hypothetical protein
MDQFNLLDLDNDILNIIGDYVKADNNIREFNELIKKDIFDYVDLKMKIIRKEARNEKYYISKSYTRYLIWLNFVYFCNNHFGSEYLNDHDKFIEITKIYNEYLTLKKLNLKEKKSD